MSQDAEKEIPIFLMMREHRTVLTDKKCYTDHKTPYEKYHDRRHWQLNREPQQAKAHVAVL